MGVTLMCRAVSMATAKTGQLACSCMYSFWARPSWADYLHHAITVDT